MTQTSASAETLLSVFSLCFKEFGMFLCVKLWAIYLPITEHDFYYNVAIDV